jgi:hypothetical protein
MGLRQAETAVRANGSVLTNPALIPELRADGRQRFTAAVERMKASAKTYAALPHGQKTGALWKEYEPRGEAYLADVAAFEATLREREKAEGLPPARIAELDRKISDAFTVLYVSSGPAVDTIK